MKKRSALSAAWLGLALILLLLAACKGLPEKPPLEPGETPDTIITVGEPDTEEKEKAYLAALYEATNGGRLDIALEIIEKLVNLVPDSRSYPVLKAGLLLSSGKMEEAGKSLVLELEKHPDNVDALFVKSELDRFSGNVKGSQAALEAILAIDPQNPDANAAMGSVYYEGKNYSKAEESFNKALKLQPDNSNALIGLAKVRLKRKDEKSALALLNRAVDANPSDALARLDRSRVLYSLGRYADSEADLDKAISLAPGSSWAYVERGRLYMDTGRKEAAKLDLDKSIELDPEYFLPYIYRAAILESDGKDSGAFDDYKTAARLYPDYWYSYESMAILAWRLGRWQDAYSAFDKASAYSSAHPEYLIAAGLSLMQAGNMKAAKAYAEKNLSKISRDKYPAQWLALRLVFDQNDNVNEFELKINSEKKLDAKAGLLFYLGVYWASRGRTPLAVNYIKMSLDYNRVGSPEYRMAEAELARLQSSK